jgi:hypothetical protein
VERWYYIVLQMYFTAKGRVDYFVVVGVGDDEDYKGGVAVARSGGGLWPSLLTGLETELFAKLEQDYKDVEGDLEEQASIVYDFRDSRSERCLSLRGRGPLTTWPCYVTRRSRARTSCP